MRRIFRWYRDEDGATAVEYAVMLTMIIAACIGAVRLLGAAVGGSYGNSATQIETYFPTGS